jgi:hypothetical protein
MTASRVFPQPVKPASPASLTTPLERVATSTHPVRASCVYNWLFGMGKAVWSRPSEKRLFAGTHGTTHSGLTFLFSLKTFRHIVEGDLGFYLWRQICAVALGVPKRFAYAQRRFPEAHGFLASQFGGQSFAARGMLNYGLRGN